MYKLVEHNKNWFALQGQFYSVGMSYDDLIEIERLLREKITQIKNRRDRS